MKKLYLLLLLSSLLSVGQTITRTFPIEPSSPQFSTGTSAPIVQTPDNGYLLNYSYSYPNWDAAPGYQSTVIKTDANFIPLWSRKLYGGNGKKTIVLNDGSSIFFSDTGSLLKLDSNGQTVFSKSNFTTYPDRLSISDAELIGNTIKVVGSKDTYNGFGYVITSTQLVIDFDTNGNVVQTYILDDAGTSTWTHPTNISKDNSGNYYITGNSYADGNYICKFDSSNTLLWCKRFKSTNDFNIITVNDIIALDNGDVLLAGGFFDYYASFGGVYLNRLSSNGDLISAKTNTTYPASINNASQLANGDIVATGWMRENDELYHKTFSMKMDSNETFSWLKLYNEGFGISVPFVKSNNDWYYSAFHDNNFDNNNPILFNTDNTGATICANDNISISFIDIPLVFNSLGLTLTPAPSILDTPSTGTSYASEIQTYMDGCIPRLLGVNDIKDKNDLIIYPNPSNGSVTIVSNSEIQSIEICNALGQKINTYFPNELETSITIDDNGMYLLRIKTTSGIKNTKVIISK